MTTESQPGAYLNQILKEIQSKHLKPARSKEMLPRRPVVKTTLSELVNDTDDNYMYTDEIKGLPYPLPEIEWIKDNEQARNILARFNIPAIGIAISYEGTADPYTSALLTIQVSPSESKTFIFDVAALGNNLIKYLEPIFKDPKVCKVMYDAKKILRFLYYLDLSYDVNNLLDLKITDQIYHAGESDIDYTLDDLALRELNFKLPPPTMQTARLASESAILHPLAKNIWPKIRSEKLLTITKLEHDVVKALALMENNGVYFNVKELAAAQNELKIAKDTIAKELTSRLSSRRESTLGTIERKINLDSPKQVIEALCSQGIKVDRIDDETLAPLSSKYPLVAKLREYNKLKYELNNFANPLLKHINSKTGRIHSNFGQLDTTTGRINSVDPNLQNIKRGKNRRFLQSEPGNLLIIADYKQIDLVVAAAMSGEDKMLKIFQNDCDIHLHTAMTITGKTRLEDVTDDERRKAKAVNFGLLYKITPYGLINYAKYSFGIDMPIQEAQRFIDLYKKEYPKLISWQDQLIKTANEKLETRTLWGRRRLFKINEFTIEYAEKDLRKTISSLGFSITEDNEKLKFKVSNNRTKEVCSILDSLDIHYSFAPCSPKPSEIVNSPIQGTAADIIKLAQVYVTHTLNKLKYGKLILNVHDELLIECPADVAKDVSFTIARCMEDAGEEILKIIRPKVNIYIGSSWQDKK